jgi:acyl carrier protein
MLISSTKRLNFDTRSPRVLLFHVEGVNNCDAGVSVTARATNTAQTAGISLAVNALDSRLVSFSEPVTQETPQKGKSGPKELTLEDTLHRSIKAAASVLCDNDVTSIEPLTSLWDIGMTSIRAISLSSVLEDEFSVKLPASIAFDYGTLSDLAGFIHREYFASRDEASGTGQTSRVDALKQAIEKAKHFEFDLRDAVMASDAFFPFSDSIEIAYNEGISSVIQPGGSIRDQDTIDFCNENNISMVFTGTRHFKH